MKKLDKLECEQNLKSYAISCAAFLLKSRRRRYSLRNKIAPTESLDELIETGAAVSVCEKSAENDAIERLERAALQNAAAQLDDKYNFRISRRMI